jgi:excisionase family DNA binding protein
MSIFPTIHVSLLNESQIAETLGVSVATIRRWRLQRRGPRFLKVGGSVRYEETAFRQWLASRPVGGEGAAEPANE